MVQNNSNLTSINVQGLQLDTLKKFSKEFTSNKVKKLTAEYIIKSFQPIFIKLVSEHFQGDNATVLTITNTYMKKTAGDLVFSLKLSRQFVKYQMSKDAKKESAEFYFSPSKFVFNGKIVKDRLKILHYIKKSVKFISFIENDKAELYIKD